MEFLVLGSLQVRRGGLPVELTRPKSRALLGLLLARANRAVLTEQLVDELWAGHAPATAPTALRVHMTNLRQALAASGRPCPLDAVSGGYRVAVTREGLDSLRFEEIVGQARRAFDDGASRQVVGLLDAALEWWRGPSYMDLRDLEPIRAEAVRLDELRLAGVELLADAYLTLDNSGAACDLLVPEAAEHPLRESLSEKLMLALYRSGRQSEALRVFGRLREALDRELGILPGAAARALEESILLQDQELDAPPLASRRPKITASKEPPFVGRREESASISQVWDAARRGDSSLVLVSGPAGIGKTTLTRQTARHVAEGGSVVLVAACEPDAASEYDPFPQLVRAALEALRGESATNRVLGELTHLVPDLADRLPSAGRAVDRESGRHRLFSAVTTLLSEAADAPLLLVIEDLHWAGRDALALLRHVLRDIHGRIMVLATYRDDEAGPGTPLGDALTSGRLGAPDLSITLDGFDTNELTAFIRADAPDGLREHLLLRLSDVQELTRGNPLFVREVVCELHDAGDVAGLRGIAPGGVCSLVERRLVRLSGRAQDLMAAASVLDRVFSLELATATADLSEREALAAIEEALDARIILQGDLLDHFTFSHPLVRNAVYRSTPTSRRARLHLRAGSALQDRVDDRSEVRSAEVARHFLSALPLTGPRVAADSARRAAEDAVAHFAYVEAATWYERSLALADEASWSAHEHATALLALGAAREMAGRRSQAREAYVDAAARARGLDDSKLLADIAIAATPRYTTFDSFHPTVLALLDGALEVTHDDLRRRAWLLCCAGAAHYYEDGSDEPFAVEAASLASKSDDPEIRAAAMFTSHRWLTHSPQAAAERVALGRELRCLCEQAGLVSLVGRTTRAILVDLLGLGRFDEFDCELDAFARLAARESTPADLYWVSALRASRAMLVDPGPETEDLVRAARTLGRRLEQGDAEGTYILQTFALRCQQGRPHEVASALSSPAPDQPRVLAGLAILAAASAQARRPDTARALLDKVVRGGQVRLPRDNFWLGATALFGGVAAAVGSPEQRSVLHDALLPLADYWCVFGAGGAVFGTGHHWLGRLAAAGGDRAVAVDHFARAGQLCVAAGARHWALVAREDLAAVGTLSHARRD